MISLSSAFTVTVKIGCHGVNSHLNACVLEDSKVTYTAGEREDRFLKHPLYYFLEVNSLNLKPPFKLHGKIFSSISQPK